MKGKKFLAFSLAATLLVGSSISVFAAGVKDVFNAGTYAGNYSDLAANYGTDASALLNHFLANGAKEGRVASPILDVAAYRAAYADLNAAFGDDWDAYVNHYLTTGILEKRTTGVLFDLVDYANKNADVKAAFGNDYVAIAQHYVTCGIHEGRPGGTIVAKETTSSPSNTSTPSNTSAPSNTSSSTKPAPSTTTETASHVHVKSEVRRVNPVDCKTDGYVVYKCTATLMTNRYEDGKFIETVPVLATDGSEVKCGHVWTETIKADHLMPEGEENVYVVQHATCTQKGIYKYTCARCGETATREVNALEHDYAINPKKHVDATGCAPDKAGYDVVECKNCGLFKENTNVKILPHSVAVFDNVVEGKEPTCTSKGQAWAYCDRCGTPVYNDIPKLEHDWNIGVTVYADTYRWGDSAPSHYAYTLDYCKTCKEIRNVSVTEDVVINVTSGTACDGEKMCDTCGLPMDRQVKQQIKVYKNGETFIGNVQ